MAELESGGNLVASGEPVVAPTPATAVSASNGQRNIATFVGGAVGSLTFHRFGWIGVTTAAAALSIGGLLGTLGTAPTREPALHLGNAAKLRSIPGINHDMDPDEEDPSVVDEAPVVSRGHRRSACVAGRVRSPTSLPR